MLTWNYQCKALVRWLGIRTGPLRKHNSHDTVAFPTPYGHVQNARIPDKSHFFQFWELSMSKACTAITRTVPHQPRMRCDFVGLFSFYCTTDRAGQSLPARLVPNWVCRDSFGQSLQRHLWNKGSFSHLWKWDSGVKRLHATEKVVTLLASWHSSWTL